MNLFSTFILGCFYSRLPRIPKTIYFYNIWWQYSDNTKALAEVFHKEYPDVILYYEVNDITDISTIPSYIIPIKKGTKESIYYKSRAAVVIDNDWGAIKKSCLGIKGKISKVLYECMISKKTFYVSTGHGTPIKKIGSDSIGVRYDSFVTSTTKMYVLDAHSADIYKRITMNQINDIEVFGSPRNDILFSTPEEIQLIKNDLVLKSKRLALFAPTFRTKTGNGKVEFVGAQEYLDDVIKMAPKIVLALGQKFGGEWVVGLRIHPGVAAKYPVRESEFVINANKISDMAVYLAVADALITDYSSCAIDYLLTKKPCFLLWTDEEQYAGTERGMYFNKELPFSKAQNVNQLIDEIKMFSEIDYLNRTHNFSEIIGMTNNKKVCKYIVDEIYKHM